MATTTPQLHLPNALKLVIGFGSVVVVNELVPEIIPAMLLLVAAYLVLSRPDVVATLLEHPTNALTDAFGVGRLDLRSAGGGGHPLAK